MKILLSLLVALPLFAQLRIEVSTERDRFFPQGLSATPDGSVWAFQPGDEAARILPDGTVIRFRMPATWLGTVAAPGPDGALWVGTSGSVGRIDPETGAVQRWSLGLEPRVWRIHSGADGNLWLVLRTPSGRGMLWIMRPDGFVLAMHDVGPGRMTDAVFGSDDALYAAIADKGLVRLTVDGVRTEFLTPPLQALSAGPGILWAWARSITAPEEGTPYHDVLKLNLRGEVLATYKPSMHPFGADALGNLWLRGSKPDGTMEIVGRLSPAGVLTRFGPLSATPWNFCEPRHFGGLTDLPDGRVAFADYYPGKIATPGCSNAVLMPAEAKRSTVTIFDPLLAPVLSVETLDRSPRRRSARP